MDVLSTSPNHYYVCLLKNNSLYPQIFICPHGWYFYDGYCHPEPKEVPKTTNESSSSEENSDATKRPKQKAHKGKKNKQENKATEIPTTEETPTTTEEVKLTTSKIDSFFSTEKAATYAADTFLADKFDLTNYESITDNVGPEGNDDFVNSFEREYGY